MEPIYPLRTDLNLTEPELSMIVVALHELDTAGLNAPLVKTLKDTIISKWASAFRQAHKPGGTNG